MKQHHVISFTLVITREASVVGQIIDSEGVTVLEKRTIFIDPMDGLELIAREATKLRAGFFAHLKEKHAAN